MRYDVVIATLNRADSLQRCLSLIEGQTEKPARVVIVDASDDHQRVKEQVMRARISTIEWRFLEADRRSLPHQRNQGIRHVHSEVVLLPDDDSMLYPDAAAEMMAAYRADRSGQLAGVSAVGVPRSPLPGGTQIERSRAFKERIEPFRGRVEDVLVPKPFVSYPQSLWRARTIPSWIDGHRFALVPTVGGYRLSLRADLAKEHLFDEVLGYGIGYALHEDMEMSLRLQRAGYLLVGAQHARVFHDVHPSKRAGGFNYGFCWIANYVYACRANIPGASASWRTDLPRFLRYKLALYRARSVVRRDDYSGDVLAGARAAWRHRALLMSAPTTELADVYKSLCDCDIRR